MDKETKKCPFCGEQILAVAKKCKYCKQFLPEKSEVEVIPTTKPCPYCGEQVLNEAKKCKFCGEWLEYKDSQDPDNVVHCQFCGKAVSSSAEKCPSCGEWLQEEHHELSCGYWMNNPITKALLGLSAVIAIIVFLFCFIMMFTEEMNLEQFFNGILATIFIPIVTFICCAVSFYVYFLPSIVAKSRNHPQIVPIICVNTFFGETGLGWIACMIWATIHRQGRNTHW